MLKKLLATGLLFYFLALLQTSFFAQLNFLGAAPNLVFALFFVLVFFSTQNNLEIFIYAVTAGFLLDIFSYSYIGPSIIILLLLAFLLKRAQSLLKNLKDNHPYIYFLPFFLLFLLIYNLALLKEISAVALGYTSLAASLFFYFYKKVNSKIDDSRQIRLF